ncbi:DUF1996 domain-containing protein [Nocardiopsis mangrovi]|uniref:DUF1996 domain-containing protein n=1 Tax=Nocardiopsis mangrovi TaxID=1179818 RepID=A0ABV9DPD2_9ACTN
MLTSLRTAERRRRVRTVLLAGLSLILIGTTATLIRSSFIGPLPGDGPARGDFVPIGDVPEGPPPAPAGPDASAGSFTSECGRNEEGHYNADNPVLTPGVPNAAHHTHEYVGNLSTYFESTDATLAAADTTCEAADDRSTYFWPVLRRLDRTGEDHEQPGGGGHGNIGEILPPSTVRLEFQGNPVSDVVAMPRFLRSVTGDPLAFTEGTGPPPAQWSCTGEPDRITDRYPLCEPGSRVLRLLDFPSCWNGLATDSEDHRTHLVPPRADGSCPPRTFPVPRLRVELGYDVPEGVAYAIDSFPEQRRSPGTDHAMFVNVMSEELMARVVDCVNSGRRC